MMRSRHGHPNHPKKPARPPAKSTTQKSKELRCTKALARNKAEGSSQPFCFNVLAQLANTPAKITLYELLKLSKSTREALREALAVTEVIMAQISIGLPQEDMESLHISWHSACITFSLEDMQVHAKMTCPCTSLDTLGHLKSTTSRLIRGLP